ncbi:putative dehydrogenase [Hydrogenispora ethanolica]|uniref:Putative dehydrogenase n=1 Tax=Hydrogenispora ethanolica TaxID=1082276 RepID=A0A4R1RIH8_HYDET|nr:Gfo/Idh/MocA family oxidoreductase [Hydrogenispora ethanolica]TCL65901.1 putative dehydrogenase [Hydrogenispora ethanolica]
MIRFGVIGSSWITTEFIRAAALSGELACNAVYSRTAERAAAFAAQHGVAHTFTDLEEMARSNTIDAVYIASPNASHAGQAILMMDHGKHVLCEKPLAANGDEVRAMIAAARRNRVVLMEALKTTLLPNFAAIRDNLPKIGRIRRFLAIKCQYSSSYDRYQRGEATNTFNPLLANGSLMDIGVYCIYPIIALFGKPDRIRANAVMLDSGIDGEGSLCLQYRDFEALAVHSKISDSALPSEIQGEAGSIVIDQISVPQKVTLRYRDGSVVDLSRPQAVESMLYEAGEFSALIQSGRLESAVNTHELAGAVMAVMDEARRQFGLRFPTDRIE